MFNYKKVSVITVAHNCARFLTTAFKSFAYQDYDNMEWIIVNNASTDSTARRLQRYRQRDSRVKLCLNTTEKGLTDSYEFAITKADGTPKRCLKFLEIPCKAGDFTESEAPPLAAQRL